MVRELEAANRNLECTAREMGRAADTLRAVAPGIVGLTGSLAALGLEVSRVRRRVEEVSARFEEGAYSGAGRERERRRMSNRRDRWGEEESERESEVSPPAYSTVDPLSRRGGGF